MEYYKKYTSVFLLRQQATKNSTIIQKNTDCLCEITTKFRFHKKRKRNFNVYHIIGKLFQNPEHIPGWGGPGNALSGYKQVLPHSPGTDSA